MGAHPIGTFLAVIFLCAPWGEAADAGRVGNAHDTVVEVLLELPQAELTGAIERRDDTETGPHLLVTGEKNGVALDFHIEEAGLYEVKLHLVSPVYHPHYLDDSEPYSTMRLDDEVRSWPVREAQQPRYRNIPAIFELGQGTHRLEIADLPKELRLLGIVLVHDSILTDERMDIATPFEMPAIAPPVFADQTFNIIDFGAREEDGPAFSEAIRRAIAACHDGNGGTVVIPAGIWHTAGPIHYKSNVRIHVDEHADVFFSTKPEDYLPAVFVRWAGIEMQNYSPLFYAQDCENIALTGKGRLVGQGRSWWKYAARDTEVSMAAYEQWVLNFVPVAERNALAFDHVFRPQFFQPIHCKNILVEDVTLESGPFWTIDVVYCENVLVRRVKMCSVGPNNDGFCPDSSRNVVVEHCFFNTEDDAIAIHTGLNDDGRRVNTPTENVVIRHNRFSGGYWGGCSIGSLTTAGIRNVLFHDNHHADMNHALFLKSARGRGGIVENIYVQDITVERMYIDTMTFTTSYSAFFGGDSGPVPTFRDISLRDIEVNGTNVALNIQGLPDRPFENLVFENVTIRNASTGGQLENVRDVRMTNVHLQSNGHEAITLSNCQSLTLDACTFRGAGDVDLRVAGANSAGIVLLGAGADTCRVALDEGAPAGSLHRCTCD